ncbi:hypothetical protein KZX46_02055 (plasmid) [Polymorphobacter sp. PAMC 29334]|uniref:hypothetical protein n=1 Tax=Polymorphobacter sp. PAMC 29334 TaxID=2862331 RepID=UPI001C785FB3|nr:hypothetical protein [Polymorphobacter sp. PAMC 29334]QYE32956.1 hypothetical protein KZX46_02055 [Polymorphobacter sp. PAMC 29334]
MIYNVIDQRTRPYRWREVNAIIEATSHDNACMDADQQPPADADLDYGERENITLQEGIAWASEQSCPVTLYLYDKGSGTA